MTTLVSAFLTNINNYRSIDKYIEYGKKLINSEQTTPCGSQLSWHLPIGFQCPGSVLGVGRQINWPNSLWFGS